jgi:DNA end-binding protein Ku
MATMLFADEIIPPRQIDELPDPSEVKTSKRELGIAEQLVDSLAGDFEPQKYRDTYREEVLALIERKAQGEKIAVQPPPEETHEPAPDLMSALKASLDAVRAQADAVPGDGAAKPRRPAAKRAAGGKAPAKKAGGPPAAAGKAGASRTPAKKPGGSRAAAKKRGGSRATAKR